MPQPNFPAEDRVSCHHRRLSEQQPFRLAGRVNGHSLRSESSKPGPCLRETWTKDYLPTWNASESGQQYEIAELRAEHVKRIRIILAPL